MNKRPDWDTYFLNIAKAVCMRSTCLRRNYGAVIVDSSKAIVSTGYNGSPVGDINCCDYGKCKREELHVPKGERYELCKAIHAEQNAIINCTKQRMIGSTIYIYGKNFDGTLASGCPCLLCERMIKNGGIAEAVYLLPKDGKIYLVHRDIQKDQRIQSVEYEVSKRGVLNGEVIKSASI